MKSMKNRMLISVVTSLALGLSMAGTVVADSTEERTFLEMKPDGGWMGYTTDNSLDLAMPSFLYGQLYPIQFRDKQGQKMFICSSTQSQGCNDPQYSLWFHANFSQCASATDTDCVEKFGLVNSDGSITEAKFEHEYAQGGDFPADPSIKLPAGHGQSVWSIKEGTTTQLYGMQVGVDGSYIRSASSVDMYGFGASIQPIQEVTGSQYYDPKPKVFTRTYGDGWGMDNTAVMKGCQVFTENKCGLRETFDPNKTVILKVRLHSQVKGWMHGRMRDAGITMENTSDGGQSITIQAKSLQVPVLGGWVKWPDLTPALQARYPVGAGGFARVLSDITNPDVTTRTLQVQSEVAGQGALDEVNAWLPLLSNKASNMKSFWTVKTIAGQLPFDLSKCPNTSGVTGFIGTNSSVYSDGPPTYDAKTGSLNYTVAAPHFDSSGNVFGGVYQLSLRSDVARCIYNFTNAPISAKIEITSADGSQRVATTTVSEKNGWLNLVAAGFEFSSPKISIKLQQETSNSSTTSKATAKKLTCIKGKLSKVVTTTNCPAGYKKK